MSRFPHLSSVRPFCTSLVGVLCSGSRCGLTLKRVDATHRLVRAITGRCTGLVGFKSSLCHYGRLGETTLKEVTAVVGHRGSSLICLRRIHRRLSHLPYVSPGAHALLVYKFPGINGSSFVGGIAHTRISIRPCTFAAGSLFINRVSCGCLH